MAEEPPFQPGDAAPEDAAPDDAGPRPDRAPAAAGVQTRRGGVRRWLPRVVIGAAAVFLLIQLIPYGRDHSNPPVVREPVWDSAATEQQFARSCGDCHSNDTTWPWYSKVAPMSWLVQKDVDEGRTKLNVSEWQRPQHEADEAGEIVREGEMPPFQYTIIHSGARLSSAQRDALAAGLEKTFAASPPGR